MSSNKPCDGPVKGPQHEPRKGFSRRTFIEGVGIGAGAAGAIGMTPEARADSSDLMGPDPVPITLNINGKSVDLEVEPRVTLIDALRNQLDHTGAKKVCDRATCGDCTVIEFLANAQLDICPVPIRLLYLIKLPILPSPQSRAPKR